MHDNYSTLWVQENLNRIGITRAEQAIQATGRALPCSVVASNGSLVTVKFEVKSDSTLPQITIPKAESQWLRAPTQVGDIGMTMPADTFLGAVSGQGSGVANLKRDYGNLGATLVFVPIATTKFTATPDANKAWVNGPKGAVIGDSAQNTQITVDTTSQTVTIKAGGLSWSFGPNGFTLANNVVAETHLHPTPSGISGTPEPS